jgi:hypothetical protein
MSDYRTLVESELKKFDTLSDTAGVVTGAGRHEKGVRHDFFIR